MEQNYKVRTVLGDVSSNELGVILPHEHICCYSEYLYQMAGDKYLNKELLYITSAKYLKELKEKYGVHTFIDCTPVNIGRDVELLKNVSKRSGVNIVCSTGFYYTEESLLSNKDIDFITDFLVTDANAVRAGIIKCAVENKTISAYDEKLLRASARAQLRLEIPIILHTNANNQNGLKALEILLSEGIKTEAVTIAHMSDTDDLKYIQQIANYGCFIGFDRLYSILTKEYITKTVAKINMLCNLGYEDKILLSHDALFFNGFDKIPIINGKPRFSYCFEHILSQLPRDIVEKIMKRNPIKMLRCEN